MADPTAANLVNVATRVSDQADQLDSKRTS